MGPWSISLILPIAGPIQCILICLACMRGAFDPAESDSPDDLPKLLRTASESDSFDAAVFSLPTTDSRACGGSITFRGDFPDCRGHNATTICNAAPTITTSPRPIFNRDILAPHARETARRAAMR
jgi:hypothetical protein